MSDQTATVHATQAPVTDVHPTVGPTLASPEFDRQEITGFGRDDGHAISVIGKMLVVFFLYSFVAMAGVALWTMWGFGQPQPQSPHSQHADDTADF
ncbi:MAG: hypothetical protein EXS05_02540 [Planctomycetaceae bacterium]|nr:hypothetical protein [Planctomycetaceae bacterium]